MTFDGQYLTYAEYKSLGGSLEETPFNLLEYEARKQIDIRTQRRLVELETIPEAVKMCDFHLIQKVEKYAAAEAATRGDKASETIDGYSVTFVTTQQIKEIISSKNVDIQDSIITDLYGLIVNGEHVIYNGVK